MKQTCFFLLEFMKSQYCTYCKNGEKIKHSVFAFHHGLDCMSVVPAPIKKPYCHVARGRGHELHSTKPCRRETPSCCRHSSDSELWQPSAMEFGGPRKLFATPFWYHGKPVCANSVTEFHRSNVIPKCTPVMRSAGQSVPDGILQKGTRNRAPQL